MTIHLFNRLSQTDGQGDREEGNLQKGGIAPEGLIKKTINSVVL